ncbi:MAG TPA: PAS domain-containing protein [Paracoccaceae bacterium]|nr:PAS domain-containing protein [Paracoccaceae bacterium]
MDGARLEQAETAAASILRRTNGFLYRCRNDANYSMIYMEGAVAVLTGHTPEAFLGEACSYAAAIHPDDQAGVIAAVDTGLADHIGWTIDYRLRRPDGTDQWVWETGGGVFAANGALLYLEGVVLDHGLAKAEALAAEALQAELAEKCRALLQQTGPVMDVLKLLRILAINARIEGARAGQAGAGFAVIAAEIGRLADETNKRAGRVAAIGRELDLLLRVRADR